MKKALLKLITAIVVIVGVNFILATLILLVETLYAAAHHWHAFAQWSGTLPITEDAYFHFTGYSVIVGLVAGFGMNALGRKPV